MKIFRVGYFLRILNTTFKIPILEDKAGFGSHFRVQEPFILHFLYKQYSHLNFSFLDVGVNIGQTLLKVKSVSPECNYIGFEPSGLCSYYTSRLIKINNIRNAYLIRVALSDTNSIIKLKGFAEGDTRASILPGFITPANGSYSEVVPTITLDSIKDKIELQYKEVILKIDVEGAEELVLNGAVEFIKFYSPVIIFENLPHHNKAEKILSQKTLSAFFSANYYTLHLMSENKNILIAIEDIENCDDYRKTNFIAIPTGRIENYKSLYSNV